MREIKFEYGFTNHAPIRVRLASIEYGLDLEGIGEITYRRQSTGLFDKNGVEIYEGDAILNKYGDVDHVVFRCGSFGMDKLADGDYMTLDRYNEECEVIGNIYEKKSY